MERGTGNREARLVWAVWGVLALGTAVAASSGAVEPVGPFVTKATVRLAMLFYGFSLCGQLLMGWFPAWERPARDAWTAAWATFAVHVACAFHYYHSWSHAHAFAHTQEVGGWGWGIYVSHFFYLSWGLDVLLWRFAPAARSARPAWLGRTLHGFWAFIVFNGMIVFETGFSRAMGVLLFATLGAILLYLRLVPPPAKDEAASTVELRPASDLPCSAAAERADPAALQSSGRAVD